MNLKDIAAVSGKSGLFKIVKPTRTGVILETIDQNRSKLIANANDRVSLLKEISIYTLGEDASKPLEKVFKEIHAKYGNTLKVDAKSSPQELTAFVEEVVPDYDKEKVYLSDIKKMAVWYTTVATYFPERFLEESEIAVAPTSESTSKDETKSVDELEVAGETEEESKPKAKKTPAKKKVE